MPLLRIPSFTSLRRRNIQKSAIFLFFLKIARTCRTQKTLIFSAFLKKIFEFSCAGYHVAGEGNLIPSEWDYLGEQRVPEEEDQDGGGRGTSVMMPCRMFSDR